jgi:hypothetical protein
MWDKITKSSIDPNKIALTIKAGVPFIVVLLPLVGVVNIGENDLIEFANQIAAIITGVVFVYGLVRKIGNNFIKE